MGSNTGVQTNAVNDLFGIQFLEVSISLKKASNKVR